MEPAAKVPVWFYFKPRLSPSNHCGPLPARIWAANGLSRAPYKNLIPSCSGIARSACGLWSTPLLHTVVWHLGLLDTQLNRVIGILAFMMPLRPQLTIDKLSDHGGQHVLKRDNRR
jgi:hypothetical protein